MSPCHKKITYGVFEGPLGRIVVGKSEKNLLCWVGFMVEVSDGAYKGDGFVRMKAFFPGAEFIEDPDSVGSLYHKVMQYWQEGREKEFPLDLVGTEFQCVVWKALLNIQKGEAQSYSDVARSINNPKAIRAVGTAVGQNPISLIIPCHRVVPQSGGIGNYGWGVHIKETLLRAEGYLLAA